MLLLSCFLIQHNGVVTLRKFIWDRSKRRAKAEINLFVTNKINKTILVTKLINHILLWIWFKVSQQK